MMAWPIIQRQPLNAQPKAARSSFWTPPRAAWAMMLRQARRSSAIQHDTVRCGFLSRRSYVAPSPRGQTSAKWPGKELTYCPIYGFKPCVIGTKDLTPALFCRRAAPRQKRPLGGQRPAQRRAWGGFLCRRAAPRQERPLGGQRPAQRRAWGGLSLPPGRPKARTPPRGAATRAATSVGGFLCRRPRPCRPRSSAGPRAVTSARS